MSNSIRYYLSRGGKTHGPYTAKQLKIAAEKGKLKFGDMLARGQDGPWVVVEDPEALSGFFGDVTTAPAPSNPFPASMTRHKSCDCGQCHEQNIQPAPSVNAHEAIEAAFGVLMGLCGIAMAAYWAWLAFSL
jgi:hypothetical protein